MRTRKKIEQTENPHIVVCKICDMPTETKTLTKGHLKTHNMTYQEYKEQFPNARLKPLSIWAGKNLPVETTEKIKSNHWARGKERAKIANIISVKQTGHKCPEHMITQFKTQFVGEGNPNYNHKWSDSKKEIASDNKTAYYQTEDGKETIEKIKSSHWARDDDKKRIIIENHSRLMIELIDAGRIKLGIGYKQGSYISTKTNVNEKYDSSYELQRMIELDEDKTVIYWTKRHHIRLPYKDNIDATKHYIPDFYIEYIDKSIIIEEVKGWIRDQDRFNRQVAAVTKYCDEKQYKFIVNFMKNIKKRKTL